MFGGKKKPPPAIQLVEVPYASSFVGGWQLWFLQI